MDPRAKFDALIFYIATRGFSLATGQNNLDIPDRVLLKKHKDFFLKTNVSLKLLTQALTMSRDQLGTNLGLKLPLIF